MATEAPPHKSRAPRWDFVMRHITTRLFSFPQLFGLPEIIGLMPARPVWKGYSELRPDFLAELRRRPGRWPGWLVAVLLHMEFVSRFRPGEIGPRLRQYDCAITLDLGPDIVTCQRVVVMGPPPAAADSESRRVRVRVDEDGTIGYRDVIYVRELNIDRLSAADRASVEGQMLGIMIADHASDADVRRLIRTAAAGPNEGERILQVRAMQALAETIPGFAAAWRRNELKEEVEAMLDWNSPAAQADVLNVFLDDPEFRDRLWRVAETRGLERGKEIGKEIGEEIGEERGLERGKEIGEERGLERGKEIGKKAALVNSMLAVLRARGIELPPEHTSALRALDCAALPEMRVAVTAHDAGDFARLAGLSTPS